MRPLVTVYAEVSADGKSTHRFGASSKPMMAFEDHAVRRYRHELRAAAAAIMVGSNTVKLDDPYLTVRHAPGKSPLRVIVSSRADIPASSHVVADGGRTLVAASRSAPAANVTTLKRYGVAVELFGEHQVDLNALLSYLGSAGMESLIVEGGATLLSSFFRGSLVDRLIVQHLSVVFGGRDTPAMVGGPSISSIEEAILLKLVEVQTVGSHAVIVYERR